MILCKPSLPFPRRSLTSLGRHTIAEPPPNGGVEHVKFTFVRLVHRFHLGDKGLFRPASECRVRRVNFAESACRCEKWSIFIKSEPGEAFIKLCLY